MAIFSFTGASIWADLSDLSNDANEVTLAATATEPRIQKLFLAIDRLTS